MDFGQRFVGVLLGSGGTVFATNEYGFAFDHEPNWNSHGTERHLGDGAKHLLPDQGLIFDTEFCDVGQFIRLEPIR